MRPEGRDTGYLWDMLDAARAIESFVQGLEFASYADDRKSQMAVERALEIIGEAARRLSDTFKAAHPEIRWRSLIGQRNILAHEYGDVSQDRIWLVATEYIPELLCRLQPLITPPADSHENG